MVFLIKESCKYIIHIIGIEKLVFMLSKKTIYVLVLVRAGIKSTPGNKITWHCRILCPGNGLCENLNSSIKKIVFSTLCKSQFLLQLSYNCKVEQCWY